MKTGKIKKTTAKHRHSRHEYGQSWMMAAALLEGPLSIEEFEEYYRTMGRRFGVFVDLLNRGQDKKKLRTVVERGIKILLNRKWAVFEDEKYHITEEGRGEARKMLEDLEKSGRILEKGTHPETVSKVTLIVHFVLAAIKLPAALLSGSIGLLNDSLDTLMDGISSLFVFFGVRSGKERLVSYILLLFMTITGAFTLFEAVMRILRPEPLTADWTAFIAVAVSAGLCAILWIYQKYSGLKHSCVPLIAQSIDSRNHIIVAGGVTAGLIATYFQFNLLDQIVGIVVSVLILKGAAELLLDLVRSTNEEEIDLSKYGFSRLDAHRHRQMVRWFLFEIEKGRIHSREQMLREAEVATDFSSIPSFRALGLDHQPNQKDKIMDACREVFESGLAIEVEINGENPESEPLPVRPSTVVKLTEAGEEELNHALSNSWSLRSDRMPSGLRGILLGVSALLFRLLFTTLVFFMIYFSLRWFIAFLPDLDLWSLEYSAAEFSAETAVRGNAVFSETGFFLEKILWGKSYSIGPSEVSGMQLICILVGIILMYCGRITMHRTRHTIHHALEGEKDRPVYLITDGPYAKRRHPMYAGMCLTSLGVGIGLHSMYVLAWAGISIIIRIFSAVYEERKLNAWFEKEYLKYKETVPRSFFSWPVWVLIILAYGINWFGK